MQKPVVIATFGSMEKFFESLLGPVLAAMQNAEKESGTGMTLKDMLAEHGVELKEEELKEVVEKIVGGVATDFGPSAATFVRMILEEGVEIPGVSFRITGVEELPHQECQCGCGCGCGEADPAVLVVNALKELLRGAEVSVTEKCGYNQKGVKVWERSAIHFKLK